MLSLVGLFKMLTIGLSNKENISVDVVPKEEQGLETGWSLLFLTQSALGLENRNI